MLIIKNKQSEVKSERENAIQYMNAYTWNLERVTTTLYARQQKRHRCKEQTFGLCGEGEGGMIWENSIETCILSHVKQMTSASSMHEAGRSKPVLRDNPEGWGEEGGERGVQDGGIYVHPWLIHKDVWQKPPQYCKVISLQL